MSFRITVKNYQSIEDVTLEVDGFTVVTGPNNSGKSALIRAIFGIFSNTRGFKFVRHGADFCSVKIEFPDGVSITWEKGPKVNRYYVGDRLIDKVDRSVPQEVLDLGIVPLEAAGREIWPQIAPQFDGQLFLVNQPGTVLAEALADVERVGLLNEALRFSQSDRKSMAGELKVRETDLIKLEASLAGYDGLEDALALVREAERMEGDNTTLGQKIEGVRAYKERRDQVLGVINSLEGVRGLGLPSQEDFCSLFNTISGDIEQVQGIQVRLKALQGVLNSLEGVRELFLDVKAEDRTRKLTVAVGVVTSLSDRYTRAKEDLQGLRDAPRPVVPSREDLDALTEAHTSLLETRTLSSRLTGIRSTISLALKEIERVHGEYEVILQEIQGILGEVQECPVCGTVTKH